MEERANQGEGKTISGSGIGRITSGRLTTEGRKCIDKNVPWYLLIVNQLTWFVFFIKKGSRWNCLAFKVEAENKSVRNKETAN